MKIDVQKFLAMTTLLAAGATQACGDDATGLDGDGGAGDSGSGGSDAGGTGGMDAAGGTGGGMGAMGGLGGDGTGGEATGGTGGSVSCVGDVTKEWSCSALPFTCASKTPYAEQVCADFFGHLRSGAFDELYTCLQDVTTEFDACSETSNQHFTETDACVDAVLDTTAPKMCESTAASATCTKITCDELSSGECEEWLNLLPDATGEASSIDQVESCYTSFDATPGTTQEGCGNALRDCVALRR